MDEKRRPSVNTEDAIAFACDRGTNNGGNAGMAEFRMSLSDWDDMHQNPVVLDCYTGPPAML
jgi:hypothetical protein